MNSLQDRERTHGCRFCGTPLSVTFADLGATPLANSYLQPEELESTEAFYPLHVRVCSECFLVQLPSCVSPETLFNHYAYFSSYSESWLRHAEDYATKMIAREGLSPSSKVIEVASNDGYLLQYFQRQGISVLGIEPAQNVAEVAQKLGIPTLTIFLGKESACQLTERGMGADLLIANNVLAHVPDLNDFVGGLRRLLKPEGLLTVEFPHLLQLMRQNQFDTIYHEHFSYLSLMTVQRIFAAHGLQVCDVDELPTHGGSLRVYAQREGSEPRPVHERVAAVLSREQEMGLDCEETYTEFNDRVGSVKRNLLAFLSEARQQGKSVVGYGAPAKGNTLLNYCGIRSDFLAFTVDRSPHKQGRYLPGSHIPIRHPDAIFEAKPDFVLILPWNLREEIVEQMAGIRDWGGQFVVPIPAVEVLL
ncbi:MAG: class I SAM-dependent methyltransferase [Gemmatimonadaceae bacterium]|nr:class I SAM-dependent methyltransferase [Gloeobacterales cyanobacterium ES-bin-141]